MLRTLALSFAIVLLARPGLMQRKGPDYLEPIVAQGGDSDGYHELVRTTLLADRKPELWMIARPSFSLEYALMLTRADARDSSSSGHYEIVYAVVAQKIWHWKEVGSGHVMLDLRRNVQVIRKGSIVPDSAAESFRRTWVTMLSQVQASKEGTIGMDGVDYEFFASPNLFGKTWSPGQGAPGKLVELSDLLVKFTEAFQPEADDILHRALVLSKKIQDQIAEDK